MANEKTIVCNRLVFPDLAFVLVAIKGSWSSAGSCSCCRHVSLGGLRRPLRHRLEHTRKAQSAHTQYLVAIVAVDLLLG